MDVVWVLAGLVAGALAAGTWARARRRGLERELAETRRRLDTARSARETFFDLTTHELRSPLAAILGFQELLQDDAYGELNPEARDAVLRIGHSARHLLNLLDGVMELSRLRTGMVQPELDTVDSGMLVSAAADAFRTLARERGITPNVEMPDHLPTIRSDPERLIRAFDLLITSAIRHPRGAVLNLRVTTADERLTVAIEPTDLELDPGDGSDAGGIRLAVAAGIATVLGGNLELLASDDRVDELVFTVPAPPPAPGL
jgi:signal transduction histidine kinase